MDQNMLTDINKSICYGTLLLVGEITVISIKTFDKTQMMYRNGSGSAFSGHQLGAYART